MDPTWSSFAGAARLGVRRLDAALGFAVTRVMSRPGSIDPIFEDQGPSGGKYSARTWGGGLSTPYSLPRRRHSANSPSLGGRVMQVPPDAESCRATRLR
jgi:hypothetical protein